MTAGVAHLGFESVHEVFFVVKSREEILVGGGVKRFAVGVLKFVEKIKLKDRQVAYLDPIAVVEDVSGDPDSVDQGSVRAP